MKFGFIGCGNMGGALAKAVATKTKEIVLSDFCIEKAQGLAKELNVSFGTNEDIVKNCDAIFLGVKPQVMESMLLSIKGLLQEKKPLLITMAAGLEIKTIEAFAGGKIPVIRIMPNTPVSLGKGMILYCTNKLVSIEAEQEFLACLENAGRIDKIAENLIDAGCAVSGCGPAFMYMYIEALADGAVACGLPRQKAIEYAAQTMVGAAEMVLQSGKHPEQLKDEVCSPAGSTIEGVKALENGGLRANAINAVKCAYERNIELGKK